MPDNAFEVFATPDMGTLTVRIGGKAAILAFLDHDAPIPVKRHPDGSIGPVLEADYYVTMLNRRPFTVDTRSAIEKEATRALSSGHAVEWRRHGGV